MFVAGCDVVEQALAGLDTEEDVEEAAEPIETEDPPAADEAPDAAPPPEVPDDAAEATDPPEPPDTSEEEEVAVDEEPTLATPCTADDGTLPAVSPDTVERFEEAAGDLTGDGQPDRLITYAAADGGFHLRVETAAGFMTETTLDHATAMAPVAPLGAAALGGDREVAFIVESAGPSGLGISLWGLHDRDDDPCALGRVTIPDHTAPVTFTVGGTVGQASGLGCSEVAGAPALLVRTAEQTGDGAYAWTETAWRWLDRDALIFVAADEQSIPEGDDLPGVGVLECTGVATPS